MMRIFRIFSDAMYRNLTLSMIQAVRNHRLEWIFINEATGIQSCDSCYEFIDHSLTVKLNS